MFNKLNSLESHIVGFSIGMLLCDLEFMGIAFLWYVVLFTLYIRRLWQWNKAVKNTKKETYTLTYRLSEQEYEEMPRHVDVIDVLIREGFDPEAEITWYDDPVYKVRIFTQERPIEED